MKGTLAAVAVLAMGVSLSGVAQAAGYRGGTINTPFGSVNTNSPAYRMSGGDPFLAEQIQEEMMMQKMMQQQMQAQQKYIQQFQQRMKTDPKFRAQVEAEQKAYQQAAAAAAATPKRKKKKTVSSKNAGAPTKNATPAPTETANAKAATEPKK